MLKVFRDNLKYLSWVLWLVIAVFVLFVFVDFGGTVSPSGGGSDFAASVGGETISYNEFERAYRRSEDFYRRIYGDQFSRETARQIGLPLQVLDSLIAERIMLREARRMELRATDGEVREAILEQGFTDDRGRFVGEETYRRILRSNGYTPETFEEAVRRQLLADKVRTVLADTVYVSEEEVEKAYRDQAEKAQIRFVRLPADRFADQVVLEPGDLEAFFARQQADFRIPEQRVVDYLLVEPALLRATLEIGDEELRAYYDSNLDRFTSQEEVRARHILLRVDESRPDEAAKSELEEIRRRIEAGADFTALATELSDDPGSKSKGGDLGFFGRGRMVPEFEEAAFGAQPGELVGPIRSGFGYHLIEVLERKPAGRRPFEDAREEIRGILSGERAEAAAESQARELAERLRREEPQTAEELQALAEGMPAVEAAATLPFGRDDNVPGIGRATAFSVAAFELAPEEVSEPVKIGRGWTVLRLRETRPPRLPELEEVRAEAEAALLAERQSELAAARLERAREEMAAGKSLDEVAEGLGLEIQESGELGRDGRVGSLGMQPRIAQAALALNEEEVGGPFAVPGGSVLFQVTERKRFDPVEFDRQKAATRAEVEQERFGELLTSLLSRRRAEMKVRYDAQFLRNFGAPDDADRAL